MPIINLDLPADTSSGANQGFKDCSPKWNQIIPGVKEGDTLVLPPNYCGFRSPILPLPSGVRLVGSGSVSHMVRCFSQGASDIFLTVGVTDSMVENVRIWAADNTSGGMAIGRHGTSPADAPQNTVLRNVDITRFTSGRFNEGIHLDGTLGAPMYGSRRFRGDSITVNAATQVGMWLGGMNSSSVTNVILGASQPTWALWLVGTAQNPCNQIKIDGPVDGTVLMYSAKCTKIDASALEHVILDANCTGIDIEAAFLNRPPIIYGQNCTVRANGKTWQN